MNTNYKNQSQFELFPGVQEEQGESRKMFTQLKCLTLSLENIIVLCIIFVMSGVLLFSFGFERGKSLVKQDSSHIKKINEVAHSTTEKKDVEIEVSISEEREVPRIVIEQRPLQQEQDEAETTVDIRNALENAFTIQVASFPKEKSAKQEAKVLKDIGYDIYVLPKGKYSIVCVGKFAQREEAKQFSAKLKDRYRDLYVRRF